MDKEATSRISEKLRQHWLSPAPNSALARAIAFGIDPSMTFYNMFVLTPRERLDLADRRISEAQRIRAVRERRDYLEQSDVACEAFRSLATIWNLSRAQQAKILDVSEDQLMNWLADPKSGPLASDRLARVFLMANIYADLQSFYGTAVRADQWPHRGHAHFDDQTPLEWMLERPERLEEVRYYTWQMLN